MKRILIIREEDEIRRHMTAAENIENWLQKIANEYQKFQVGDLTAENVWEVLSDPEGQVKQQIIDNIEAPEMAGFALKKELLIEQLALPDLNPLKQLIAEVQRWLQPSGAPQLSAFEINAGRVSIRENYEDEVTEKFSVYAETPEEIKLWKALEKFKAGWEELDELKENYLGIQPRRYPEAQVRPFELLNIEKQFLTLKRKLDSVLV